MSAGKTKISKERRFGLDDTSKEKLREKACAPFKSKFQHMKYAKMVNGSGEAEDLGKILLVQQT